MRSRLDLKDLNASAAFVAAAPRATIGSGEHHRHFAARGTKRLVSRQTDELEIDSMNLAEKKAVVVQFITKCNDYADGKLVEYRRQLDAAPARDALAIQDKIGHWAAYRAFNEHTLGELATPKLDAWFE
jgi:hypothetical protein